MTFIKSIFRHSKSSFEELVEADQERLYKIAYAYVKNEQDALDIVQDAIVKGIKSFHKLNDSQYFRTWMTRILINTAIDFLRKKKEVVYLEPDWLDSGMNLENKSITKMDFTAVFDQLKPEQKSILLLRYYEGYTVPEIAKIMNKREGTVKSQLYRTLNQIKVKLGNGGDSYGEYSSRCK